jgi:hypothetical protein
LVVWAGWRTWLVALGPGPSAATLELALIHFFSNNLYDFPKWVSPGFLLAIDW